MLDSAHQRYVQALLHYLGGDVDRGLSEAYELGRAAFDSGHSVAEMMQMHHETLAQLVEPGSANYVLAGTRMAAELFAHLDSELLRLRNYQTEQRSLNALLRKQAAALDQTNEALRVAKAEAEAGGRAKAEFLANMSHRVFAERDGLSNEPQRSEVFANQGLRCGSNGCLGETVQVAVQL